MIPEGGSNALGSLGYVVAMAELRDQLPAAWREGPFTVAYAAGSGGTGAGIELGVRARWAGEARPPLGFAVCNDAGYFREAIAAICAEARRALARAARRSPPGEVRVDDGFVGPGLRRDDRRGTRDHPARRARGRRPPRSGLHREGDARPRDPRRRGRAARRAGSCSSTRAGLRDVPVRSAPRSVRARRGGAFPASGIM